MKERAPLELGEVLTFTVGRRYGLCQVVRVVAGPRTSYEVVVFDAFFARRPGADAVDGKPIYVLRVAPRNEPLYLRIDGPPPTAFRQLGARPLALAFELPRSFRVSPQHMEDTCPVWSTWSYIVGRLKNDFDKKGAPAEPYASRHFPAWTDGEPEVLRAVDKVFDALARKLSAGTPAVKLRALRGAVVQLNRFERDIDSPTAEELHAALCAAATAGGLDGEHAAELVDAQRSW